MRQTSAEAATDRSTVTGKVVSLGECEKNIFTQ